MIRLKDILLTTIFEQHTTSNCVGRELQDSETVSAGIYKNKSRHERETEKHPGPMPGRRSRCAFGSLWNGVQLTKNIQLSTSSGSWQCLCSRCSKDNDLVGRSIIKVLVL